MRIDISRWGWKNWGQRWCSPWQEEPSSLPRPRLGMKKVANARLGIKQVATDWLGIKMQMSLLWCSRPGKDEARERREKWEKGKIIVLM